jgi:hypothetical protein
MLIILVGRGLSLTGNPTILAKEAKSEPDGNPSYASFWMKPISVLLLPQSNNNISGYML